MSVIYYKFKSHKDHKHISFEGHALSLFDLKCEIIRDNKLGKGTDFDLVVQNAQTNEEYKDDSDLIPRSTSVIVRRMPPVAPGKGTAQRYIKGIMGVVGGAQMATDRGGQLGGRPDVNITTGQASGTRKFGHQTLVNIPKPTSTGTASSATGIGASATPPMNLPNEEESEEMRIQAMFQQEKEQWQQQQAQMADATPIYRPGQRPRPNNAAGGSGGGSGGSGGVSGSNNTRSFQSYPEREPPPNYVCYRCGEKGHFIQHCPTNGDAAFDRPRIRRTTGIPKSFLKAIDKPTDKKSGVMVTDVGGFVVATPDSNAWEKHVAMHRAAVTAGDVHERMDAPPELACVICKGLMRDAVSTPCCDAQGCEECLSKSLRDNNMTCTQCNAPDQSVDLLVPNYRLRDAVDQYLRQQTTFMNGGGGGGNEISANGHRAFDRESTNKSETTQGKRIATLMTDHAESSMSRNHRGPKRDHHRRSVDTTNNKSNNTNATTSAPVMGVNMGLSTGFPTHPHPPPPMLNPMNPVMRSLMMIPPTIPGAPTSAPSSLPHHGFPAGFIPPPPPPHHPGFPFGMLPPMPPPGMIPMLGDNKASDQSLHLSEGHQGNGETANANGSPVGTLPSNTEEVSGQTYDHQTRNRHGDTRNGRRSRSPSTTRDRYTNDHSVLDSDRASLPRRRDAQRGEHHEQQGSSDRSGYTSRDRGYRDSHHHQQQQHQQHHYSSTSRHRSREDGGQHSQRHRSHPYQQRSRSKHN